MSKLDDAKLPSLKDKILDEGDKFSAEEPKVEKKVKKSKKKKYAKKH